MPRPAARAACVSLKSALTVVTTRAARDETEMDTEHRTHTSQTSLHSETTLRAGSLRPHISVQ